MATLNQIRDEAFHYIIVGGGTSGCLLSARLAACLPQCRILLVEAGKEDAADPDNLVPGYTKPKFGSEEGNWLYETEPQLGLGGRTIIYPRGRGLGGCSANNFMAWARGPDVDYDAWAELSGDRWWQWENVKEVLKQLEDFDPACPKGMERYASPTPGAHGAGGPIGVQFGRQWQAVIPHCLEASEQAGHPLNADNNDGNPIGFSVAQFNVKSSTRITSPGAFLRPEQRNVLKNLTIVTGALCSKVIFEKKRAVAVELRDYIQASEIDKPIQVKAIEEVILTAGSFQSTQLLLLSGIGPSEHLSSLNIPIVADIQGVGRNIRDHSAIACEYIIAPTIAGHNQLLNSPELLAAAQEEYENSRSGPLGVFGASACIIFPRLPGVLRSPEMSQLDAKTQSFLEKPTRPSTEIWMHSGPLFYTGPCPPDASVLVIEGLNQNCLSAGTLTLRSTDPRIPPRIDLQYLAHPFDVRTAIETAREIVRLAKTPALRDIIRTPLMAPAGDSDAELEQFVRETLTQGFHCLGSCVMGSPMNSDRVVGPDYKVVGVEGLRIADMSVCPVLTCNHTQVNAYLIGLRCADLLIQEISERKSSAKL